MIDVRKRPAAMIPYPYHLCYNSNVLGIANSPKEYHRYMRTVYDEPEYIRIHGKLGSWNQLDATPDR